MKRAEHERLCEIVLGESCREVHNWLDTINQEYENPFLHWLDTHHLEAVGEKYHEDSIQYKAAVLHIISDWIANSGRVILPKDREELVLDLKKVLKIDVHSIIAVNTI